MNKKILIVEDDKNISDILCYNLNKENYKTTPVYDGFNGLENALEGDFDLVLLDVMLPNMDGFEVLKRIREKSNIPVIMLTAKEEEVDKVLGLELGADDYITKPFSVKELLARIKANIRRHSLESVENKDGDKGKGGKEEYISKGDLAINTRKFEVLKKGTRLDVSMKEYELLKLLIQNPGTVYSREQLLELVWGYESVYGDLRVVDVMVSRLRKKLEDNPSEPQYIQNRRGAGYYLDA